MAVTILVAGGYGEIGKVLCPLLLDNISGSTLIIAGRSLEKATAYSKELNKKYPNRTTPTRIDVGRLESLEAAPPFNVLINLMTLAKVTGKMRGDAVAMAAPTAQVMKFAVSRNAVYMDPDPVPVWIPGVWKEVEKMMGATVEPVVLCGAGVNPGVVGPFMKLAATPLDKCTEAYFETVASVPPLDAAVDDFFLLMPRTSTQLLQDGVWQKAPMILADKVDMGDGKLWSRLPMYTADIEPLANELGCKTLGSIVSSDDGAPGVIDQTIGYLGAISLGKCSPCLEGFFKAKYKKGMAKNFQAAPNLMLFQGRAIGTDAAGNAKESVLRVNCLKGERMCAAYCMVAQLQQVLGGAIKGNQPVRLASWATDPAKLKQFLKGCGPDIFKIDEFCT